MKAKEFSDLSYSCSFYYSGGNLTNRIVWALLIEVIVFVVTIILAMVDTSEWPGTFCYLTIASIVVLNSKLYFV